MAAVSYGGYDSASPEQDQEKFCCSICTKVFRDPHITKCCGQNFCESCLNYWFTRIRKESCPHCRAEGHEFQHFLDKKLKREIDCLRVLCTSKEEGCQWVGEIGSVKDHLKSANGCGYVKVKCPNKCAQQTFMVTVMDRKDLENHLENECYLRPYQCEHCGVVDSYENITGKGNDNSRRKKQPHYVTCPEFPLECPNECGLNDIKRKDMQDHRSECPNEQVKCTNQCLRPLLKTGSFRRRNAVTIVKRRDLAKHLEEECELRPYQCEHCKLENTYKAINTHYTDCPKFPLECPNKCGVKDIKRKDMRDHRNQCPEEEAYCTNKCQKKEFTFPDFLDGDVTTTMKRKHLEKHLIDECELRSYQCKHCTLVGTYGTITTHYTKCPKFPLECPNKCGANDIKREDMENHRSQCPEEEVECPFEEAGCDVYILRRELEQHLATTQQQHLLMVMGAYKEMKQELKRTQDKLDRVTQRLNPRLRY